MQVKSRISLYLGLASLAFLPSGAVAREPVAPGTTVEIVRPQKIFNAETFTLDNGLQIIVIPNHRAPVVTHMVWYKAGAADEPAGKSGIAHFLEHLMFKGTPDLAPGEFSKKIRALGGVDNAFTSQDYTAYYQSISVDHLETVMKMEAERMRALHPPPEEVVSENKVILEERRQRTENSPGAKLGEQMNALMYVNHPYAKPVIGWAHEMASLTWEDAKTFYDLWYVPNNAYLIVAGDVTGEQVYNLAKEIYGPLQKSESLPERIRISSPPFEGQLEVTLKDPTIREPIVQTGYRVPSSRQNKKEALALEVLDEIMGGGPSSRLYKSLVINQKIATSAGFSYRAHSWDDSEAWIYATPALGQDLKSVKAALDQELRLLVAKGINEQELKDAVNRLTAEAIYARDSLSGPAMAFGYVLASGGDVNDVEFWAHNIAQVTAEDILSVAKKYLDPDIISDYPPVTGYLVPEDPEQLAPAGSGSAPAPVPPVKELQQ